MILPWLGALAIGLALGLLGSGGSILTVPVLVYLIGQDEKTAIAGSLFIVGSIAAAGGLQYARQRKVDGRSVLLFGLPGMAGTYAGAWLGGLVSGALQLLVFAVVMILAAWLMLRSPMPSDDIPSSASPLNRGPANGGHGTARHQRKGWKVALDGLAVGVLTGFVGVGGGFLIVPALVLLGGLPMHVAVGTSLVVIALKSFTGFWKYLDVLGELGLSLDWHVLLLMTGVGIAGSFAGRLLAGRISQDRLKKVFAGFLIVIAVLILWQSGGDML